MRIFSRPALAVLSVSFAILASHSAFAGSRCTADSDLCIGKSAFVYQPAEKTLAFGKISAIEGDAIEIQATSGKITTSRKHTASTRSDVCLGTPEAADHLCPKDGTRRTVDGTPRDGIVLGIFPTGYVVVSEAGQPPVSLPWAQLARRNLHGQDQRKLIALVQQFGIISRQATQKSANPKDCGPASSAIPRAPETSLAPDSLRRMGSFARVLLDSPENPVLKQALGEECSRFLTQLYAGGRTLKSNEVYRNSAPLATYPFRSGGAPLDFFHYTKHRGMLDQFHPEIKDRSAAHRKSLADGTYDRSFQYMRTNTSNGRTSIDYKLIYVAEDHQSSSSYGPHRLTFHLNPQARIYAHPETDPLPEATLTELSSRVPGLFKQCKPQIIFHLVMEDSGIDLVDYFHPSRDNYRQWFEMIRPNAIQRVDLRY